MSRIFGKTSPTSIMLSAWKAGASRPRRSASSTLAPPAMQPGKSGNEMPYVPGFPWIRATTATIALSATFNSPAPTGLSVDRAQRPDGNLFHAHVDGDHHRPARLVVIDMVAAAGAALPAVPLQTPADFARTFGRMPGHGARSFA